MTDKSVGQLEDRHCPEDTQHWAQDTNIEFCIPHSLKKKKGGRSQPWLSIAVISALRGC